MRRTLGWTLVLGLAMSVGCGGPAETPPVASSASSPTSGAEPTAAEAPASPPAATTSEPGPAAAPAEATPAGPAEKTAADGELQLDRLTFKVPPGWARKEASSSFVLVEYTLPKAEGSEDGRLTVSVAGGSVEANVDRWKSQFGGKPEKEVQEKKDVGGVEVTVVDFTGEFNDQRGPFSPPAKRANYRMIAAIIPVEGELHFVKATGPAATMENHRQAFLDFISSARKK